MLKNEYDVLGVNETWLDSSISDHELSVDGYDLVRHDRNRYGGGVCLFIKQTMNYTVLCASENNAIESIWIRISVKNHQLKIGCAYRPPSADQTYFNYLLDQIEEIKLDCDDFILMGDLNYDYVNRPSCPVHTLESLFGMTQLVDKPTRVTQTSSSLIDVILSSVPNLHTNTEVVPISLSDHYLVCTSVAWNMKAFNRNHNLVHFRDFKCFDVNSFVSELSHRHEVSDTNFNGSKLQDRWEKFKNTFISVCERHAPMKSRRLKQRFNPWITSDIIKLIYERNHLKTQHDKHRTDELLEKYRKLRNKVTMLIRVAKRSYYENELSNVYDKPRETWKIISKLTGKHCIQQPPAELTAQSFNDYFTEVGSNTVKHLSVNADPPWKGPISDRQFRLEPIKENSVYERLKALGQKPNNDLLGMDCKLLCLSASVITPVLTQLFNASISSNTVIDDWKLACVTPVYKGKGAAQDKGNYRPISVLPHVAKILEREIQSQLTLYLAENNYLSLDQSAYRMHHNTQTALCRVIDDWLDCLCDDMYIGVCMLDIKKCFDTINHTILCQKLRFYGIVDNEFMFFTSYLQGRSQVVKCNGAVSNKECISLGVPQGSVLGPILFLLYINDVSQHIYLGKANIYADDMLIYTACSSVDEVEENLQKCLNDVQKWYDGNRLIINASKSSSMLIQPRKNTNYVVNVSVNDEVLHQSSTATYLGIDIQDRLQWNHHIDKLCSRLSFKISKLTRLRSYTPPRVLRKIYFACVQPTIDYAITVWGNAPLCYLQNVQRLQNFAGRVLANDFDYVNSRGIDILKSQRIMNVKQRFIYFSLVQMFKCIHGLAPDYLCDDVLMACEVNDRSTRFCDFNNVYVPFPRKELFKKTFIYNAGSLWNNMPNHLKEISVLSGFKNALRCYVFMSF